MPQIPYVVWAVLIVGHYDGAESGWREDLRREPTKCCWRIMSVVVVFLVWLAIRYICGTGRDGLDCSLPQPFYNPKTFNAHKILTATSFAALTYIGFDGVTTLAEDVENPKRNVLLAVVLTCIFAGVCSGFEAYLGARVWPDWQSFPNLETAFMDICSRRRRRFFSMPWASILIVAAFGSGLTGTLGAARLLFGMGRDNVLPRIFRTAQAGHAARRPITFC